MPFLVGGAERRIDLGPVQEALGADYRTQDFTRAEVVVVFSLNEEDRRFGGADRREQTVPELDVGPRHRARREGDEGADPQVLLGRQEGLDAAVGTARHHDMFAIDERLLLDPSDRGDDVLIVDVLELDHLLLKGRSIASLRLKSIDHVLNVLAG